MATATLRPYFGCSSLGLLRIDSTSAVRLSRMYVAAKISEHDCTTVMSRLETESTSSWPRPGIDEHHLDDDHADHQVGQGQDDHVDDRRQRVGQGMAHDDPRALEALEIGHLDVRAGQQVDDRRPGHAHHVRHHHQGQRQRRQGAAIDPIPELPVLS